MPFPMRSPLLRRADQVLLVTSGKHAHAEGTQEVAEYLARHGAPAATHFLTKPEWTDQDELLQFVRREEADLLVMGAYGHSRLREWAVGGVTRFLLDNMPVCCLMNH